jgi:hypothetical protein
LQQRHIIERIHEAEIELGELNRRRLRLLRELEISGEWDYGEFRDLTHWVACHLQISWIDAKRRVEAAGAIEALPVISSSLESGELSLDKAVQLTRHATPETEEKLVAWARTVSVKTVRENADAACARDLEEVKDNDRARNFGWSRGDDTLSGARALPARRGECPLASAARWQRLPAGRHHPSSGHPVSGPQSSRKPLAGAGHPIVLGRFFPSAESLGGPQRLACPGSHFFAGLTANLACDA